MIQFCRDSKLNVDAFKYLETGHKLISKSKFNSPDIKSLLNNL